MKIKEEFLLSNDQALNLIWETRGLERLRHISIYLSRVIFLIGFCILFVSSFKYLFGAENAISGVAVLLMFLTFRKIHLGYNIGESLITIVIIFIIYGISPYISSNDNIYVGLLVNTVSIFIILILGCDNINYFHHAILVLSYLLLYGNRVEGEAYFNRLYSLGIGIIIILATFYINHRGTKLDRGIKHIILDFNLKDEKNLWQLNMAFNVSFGMFIGQLLGLERPMWIGITIMSILSPFSETRRARMKDRLIGTALGCLLFYIISLFVPSDYYFLLGIVGGVCVSFTSSYRLKTVFNALGALGIAFVIYNSTGFSISLRLVDTIFAIAFVIVMSLLSRYIVHRYKLYINKK